MRISVLAIAFSVRLAAAATLESVAITPTSFNPSLGDTVKLSAVLTGAARIRTEVIDRDGYLIRLLSDADATAGVRTFVWDGKDAAGKVVPDEAYSFRISLNGAVAYFPAARAPKHLTPNISYYDQRTGTVAYQLASASRVHMQAGAPEAMDGTRLVGGGLLRTIVNRQPRTAGAVIESWNGYDESGTIYVPSLKNFVMSLAVTELPENSVIAHGNRRVQFLDYARDRGGESLLPAPALDHRHHAGLTALDDVSPGLSLAAEITEEEITLKATPTGLAADRFIKQPGRIFVFIDYKTVAELPAPKTSSASIRIPNDPGRSGARVLTVNWVSDYGPVAANSTLLSIPKGRAR